MSVTPAVALGRLRTAVSDPCFGHQCAQDLLAVAEGVLDRPAVRIGGGHAGRIGRDVRGDDEVIGLGAIGVADNDPQHESVGTGSVPEHGARPQVADESAAVAGERGAPPGGDDGGEPGRGGQAAALPAARPR